MPPKLSGATSSDRPTPSSTRPEFGASVPAKLRTSALDVSTRSTAVANGADQVIITATATPPDVVDFTAPGGQLSAANVESDDAGVAKSTLTATAPGTITVTATAGGTSASITVTFTASTGPRLRFRTSPANTMAQNLLRPVPEVVLEDGSGAVMTSSSASVTVAITPGSCSATLDASSLMTVSAVQGVASFYGLKSSTVASGCTLTATSASLQPAVSTAFDLQ